MTKTSDVPTITILGTGYLGLTTAAVLSQAGFTVYAVDPNPDRLDVIKAGRSFFFEEGLNPLVEAGIRDKTLIATSSYKLSIPHSDIILSCVGTPDRPDGSVNLDYVYAAATEAAKYLKPDAVFVQKSTVPVGTGRKIKDLFAAKKIKTPYISNPEFLRESSSVSDTLFYDRLVFGGDGADADAIQKTRDVFTQVDEVAANVAAHAGISVTNKSNRHIVTSLESAELIKAAANSFLALKISFANSIAKLSDRAGADITEIMEGVGADQRIGQAFLKAGRGYGGGCFPKDVSGLIDTASNYGVDLSVMTAAQDVNESMPGYIINKAIEAFGDLKDKRMAVLGLAFKSGTSDVRRSPGVAIANRLDHDGAIVTTFDPEANGTAKADLRSGVTIAKTMEAALQNADAIFVATTWPEFVQYDPAQFAAHASGKGTLFVDCMNAFGQQQFEDAGMMYIGVGRN